MISYLDDIENQKALWLANEADPEGLRTIGVLTKPDMLLPSSIKATELWLDVIEGRRHPLTHGYFCTRRPDDSERTAGVMFARTAPWSTSADKGRFGTNHLISTLSTLLVGTIHNMLPTINKETQRLLALTATDLAALPAEPDSAPAMHILALLSGYCDDVRRQVVGGGFQVGTLVQENKDSYATFKASIRRTAPNLVPLVKPASFAAVMGVQAVAGARGPVHGQVDGGTVAAPYYLDERRNPRTAR